MRKANVPEAEAQSRACCENFLLITSRFCIVTKMKRGHSKRDSPAFFRLPFWCDRRRIALCAAGLTVLLALLEVTRTLSFAAAAAATPSVAPGRSLTVAFWNIQWFPGQRPNASANDKRRQINAVHSQIRSFDPDILGMEEVRDFAKAGLAVQPLRDFKVDVCANFPPREGQTETQEVAITSRLPASSAWAEQWRAAGAVTPPRGFAFAAYEVDPGRWLLVYCVHLKSNLGDLNQNIAIRQESTRQLLVHMADMEKAYGKLGALGWIVGGDFNTSLDDPRFAKEKTLRDLLNAGLLWCWQNVPASARMTLPPGRDFPAACFDHIFYRGLKLRRASVASTTLEASDHCAIVATFDW